jgi:hypothetical protein
VRKVTARFVEVIAITSSSGDCAENSVVNLNRGTCHVEESHPHRCTVLRVGCRNSGRSHHRRAACFSKRTLHWVQLLLHQPNSGVLSPRPSAALVNLTRKAARDTTAEQHVLLAGERCAAGFQFDLCRFGSTAVVSGISASGPLHLSHRTIDGAYRHVGSVPRAAVSRCSKNNAYSITSSARKRIAVGRSIPIALAVFRFTTISNLVGCSIGKSAGLAPRAIRSTNSATRPKSAVMLGP